MKKLLFILIFLVSINTYSSYPEFFGASFSTSDIGNQANLDPKDPSNNYYIPALLGFSENVNILIQAASSTTHFQRMTNITVTNNTNSNSPATKGNVENNYPNFEGSALHLGLPIGIQHLGTLGLSLFLPIGSLIDSNSGNPFLPEYVMYRSRYRRVSAYINFARKINDELAWSLGTIVGFQAGAEVKTNLSLGGASYGSWGQTRAKIAPSLGLIASCVKKINRAKLYLTYQQEMKSNFHAGVSGEVTNPPLAIFESGFDSMMYYDPHTFRLGSSYDFGNTELFASLEYLMWSGYKTPIITISKTGGVIVPSSNFEQIKIRDTINPRLGVKVHITDRWSAGLGVGHRMTPFDSHFNGSGNSIDTNATLFSTGLEYRIVIWSKDVNLGTSFEYQQLQKKHVEKSADEENGSPGEKIGSGGYDINGHVLAATFGVKFNF